jgi:hypothetical protein
MIRAKRSRRATKAHLQKQLKFRKKKRKEVKIKIEEGTTNGILSNAKVEFTKDKSMEELLNHSSDSSYTEGGANSSSNSMAKSSKFNVKLEADSHGIGTYKT